MPDVDDNIAFELWSKRSLFGRLRWHWHCKSVRKDGGGNSRIVFSGQSSGYSSQAAAMDGINIARGTDFSTPVNLIVK